MTTAPHVPPLASRPQKCGRAAIAAVLCGALVITAQLRPGEAHARTQLAALPGLETAVGNVLASAPGPGGAQPTSIDICGRGRVWFDGSCREHTFFERFKTRGAEFLGVYGPQRTDAAHDTGVIVVERVDASLAQLIYVLPYKVPAGQAREVGTQYRRDYPLAGISSFSTWVDSTNRVNTMAAFSRRLPRVGTHPAKFGVAEWSHRAETGSGYRLTDSNGQSMVVAASTGTTATDTCKAAGTAHGEFAAAVCKTAAFVGAASLGIAAGVTVGVFLSGASVGVGTPGAAAAGVAVGGTTFTVTAATGVAICQNLGDSIEASDQAQCPLVANGAPIPPEIRPPRSAEAESYAQNDCPSGQVRYSGEAQYCTDGGDDIDTTINGGIEEVTVDDNFSCTTFHANNQCIPISAFG